MCNKAVDNYPHALEFVPEYLITLKMCNKAVNNYPSKIVRECFVTQKACDKAVNRCFFVFDPIHDWCKTQERCDRLASEDLFNCILP